MMILKRLYRTQIRGDPSTLWQRHCRNNIAANFAVLTVGHFTYKTMTIKTLKNIVWCSNVCYLLITYRDRRGHGRMVVGFTTRYNNGILAISGKSLISLYFCLFVFLVFKTSLPESFLSWKIYLRYTFKPLPNILLNEKMQASMTRTEIQPTVYVRKPTNNAQIGGRIRLLLIMQTLLCFRKFSLPNVFFLLGFALYSDCP